MKATVKLGAAAPRPRADSRKKNVVQVVPLRAFKLSKELLLSFGASYLLKQTTTSDLCERIKFTNYSLGMLKSSSAQKTDISS